MAEKQEFKLPDEISKATQTDSEDLVIISIPKAGKGTILGKLTEERNAIVFDLEKGGYSYISARKMSIYTNNETTLPEAFANYIKIRNLLLENKGKYDYLIIDGLSDLDVLSELGGTYVYMDSIIGKKFNRDERGDKLKFGDPNFRLVTTLPDGAGYSATRRWFLDQIDIFKQISKFRIYASHIADKYIKENSKEEVVGSEISLTGKLKTIFASKVTSLAKLVVDDDKRYLSFTVANSGIIAGSRNPKLEGNILISEKDPKTKEIKCFWNNIYTN